LPLEEEEVDEELHEVLLEKYSRQTWGEDEEVDEDEMEVEDVTDRSDSGREISVKICGDGPAF